MLESITIKDFGIISSLTLDLSKGLNILTGETGAGKSIVIDALRFSLGERFQSSYLRDKAKLCLVETVMSLPERLIKNIPELEAFPCEEGQLVIQRSVTSEGKNRIRINGLTSTVGQLKAIGDHLIDFHGPHDHQLLLSQEMHLSILDALAKIDKPMSAYQEEYTHYCSIQKELNDLRQLARSRARDLELLSHQIKELEQVPLNEDRYQEVDADRIKINNAEKLVEDVQKSLSILENDQLSLESMLSNAYSPLRHLSDVDPNANTFLEGVANLQENAQTLVSGLRDYALSLNFDQTQAEEVNRQYDAYLDILRKYGPTLAEAQVFYEDALKKFELLNDAEQNEETLLKAIKASEKTLSTLATVLSKERQKTAISLKKIIESELKELGFKSVIFKAQIEQGAFTPCGHDVVTFLISPNTGESVKPLAEIVSSGESARIMLAIKKALMKVDPVPVLIFDEIDAQIGGRLGTVIGTKLKEISQHRQVVLITHLPQIAAFADRHFKISKSVKDGRTVTEVAPVDEDVRLEELAQMMAGNDVTPAAMEHARQMLERSGSALSSA